MTNILLTYAVGLSVGFFAAFALTSCTDDNLGDKISLNIIQIKAKQNNDYCYVTVNNDRFCVIYMGKAEE